MLLSFKIGLLENHKNATQQVAHYRDDKYTPTRNEKPNQVLCKWVTWDIISSDNTVHGPRKC